MQFVAGPNGTRPTQFVETDAENAPGRLEFAIDHKAHGEGCGMPAARHEAAESRFARGLVVEMVRLRIEFSGEGQYLFLVDASSAGVENLSHGKIFEIPFGHLLAPVPGRRRGDGGAARAGLSNHAPPATAAALMRPNVASATASAMKTSDRLPVHRSASQPPPAAISRRARLASNGHSKRPAPCEAK